MYVYVYVCGSCFNGIIAIHCLYGCREYKNNNNTILWFPRNVTLFQTAIKTYDYMLSTERAKKIKTQWKMENGLN